MRLVVTGGAGDLGSRVVRGLAGRGHEVVSASRRTGVDLATGRGLDAVLEGTDAVVHCADDTGAGDAVTVYGTRRVADAAATRGIHLVHVSIVGIDDHPLPYYRRKLRAEQGILAAGGASTILRATQFHSLAAYFARALTKGPLTFTIGDMAFQPVDTDAVAARLVELALGRRPDAPTRARDLAGPDVLSLPELATLVRAHRGASAPRVVHLPAVGATMHAFARGRTVPPPGTADLAGRPFVEWLAEQPAVLTGR
ncbi:SDR family oxidoreductase [Intrasporangium flavum]|uniref:SDR family oxidoreductase n=1 Tax=Intrasporangium flavum TaxID=1428657 RepID=UPI00096BFC50|nr:sugar nucleotide-binding protein [Intrasporangium flavum]